MKKLLIAADLQMQLTNAMTFLQRSGITVVTAATNEELLKLHIEEHADLVITRPDLPGMSCEMLLNIFRRSATLRNAAVILICEDTPAQRDLARKCGATVLMTRPIAPAALEGHIQELLHVVPRRSYRVVMNMKVEGRQNGKAFLCSTENVSSDGMLIRTTETLPMGSRISCSFYLPDGTRISAGGTVARITDQDPQSQQNRYGIQLTTLAPDARTALSAFVNKEALPSPASAA